MHDAFDVVGYYTPREPDYVVPSTWTWEHVLHRMVLAYEILERQRFAVGPSGMKSAWPQIWRDKNDDFFAQDSMQITDPSTGNIRPETREEMLSRLSRDVWSAWESEDPPTAHEITLMEEAFLWPPRYLKDKVRITRWAILRARGGQDNHGGVGMAVIEAEAKIIAKGLARDRVAILHEDFNT